MATPQVPARPLVGAYRAAHAARQVVSRDGVDVVQRYDRTGADGWWRTWNTWWRPRRGDARVLLSPEAGCAPDVVGLLTARLREVPYLLACPSEPARLASSGAVVLHLARPHALTPALRAELTPLLRPDSPPLCLPLAPGIAFAQCPDNGMSFGEHRCHLVALAFEVASGGATTLDAIARGVRGARDRPVRAVSQLRRAEDSGRPGDPGWEVAGPFAPGLTAVLRRWCPRAGRGCGSGPPGCPGPSWC